MCSERQCGLRLLLALPLVAATLGLVAIAASERLTVRGSRGPLNSAEAAAAGNAAEMIRYLEGGEGPAEVRLVRPGAIPGSARLVTTLEAAVWAGDPALVRLLDERGAIVDADMRHHLACLAADLGLPATVDVLNAAEPAACEPGRAEERVRARTAPL